MISFVTGLETEYGCSVEGRGANTQIDDAQALVRSLPGECRVIWDYRVESPRQDLRGFRADRLEVDPVDAAFDEGKHYGPSEEVRADQILANGARFYNDHGHPEYATPECRSLDDLLAHDRAGEAIVLQAARAYAESTGRQTTIYKNNTDYHGASYGFHESYLVPRDWGFERLYAALTPLLVARIIVCGAGKAVAESGRPCDYQISQRADFFSERASVDTLYRRPIFNTRDEPHSNPADWVRLHVIAGDANMMPSCTWRKVGLIRLGLALMAVDAVPNIALADPVRAIQAVSRDMTRRFEIAVEDRIMTTAYEVLNAYLDAGERHLAGDAEFGRLIVDVREILESLPDRPDRIAGRVDWIAKRQLLQTVVDETGLRWGSSELLAYDLEYHNVDPNEGLYFALRDAGMVKDAIPTDLDIPAPRDTRARARGLATRYPELERASWGTLVFRLDGELREVTLDPERDYSHVSPELDVDDFIRAIRTS
ncbi:MAG: proteasome accessory factor PafA2 family protein [Methanoregulaceae archaeon]|nr:proteasome accessory factor PafA2 family protein [Methanoregulaceae archaeon]